MNISLDGAYSSKVSVDNSDEPIPTQPDIAYFIAEYENTQI